MGFVSAPPTIREFPPELPFPPDPVLFASSQLTKEEAENESQDFSAPPSIIIKYKRPRRFNFSLSNLIHLQFDYLCSTYPRGNTCGISTIHMGWMGRTLAASFFEQAGCFESEQIPGLDHKWTGPLQSRSSPHRHLETLPGVQ